MHEVFQGYFIVERKFHLLQAKLNLLPLYKQGQKCMYKKLSFCKLDWRKWEVGRKGKWIQKKQTRLETKPAFLPRIQKLI